MSMNVTELEKKLNQTTDVIKKIDIFNELAIELLHNDLTRSREYNKKALSLSKQNDYDHGLAYAEYCYGMYLWKKGSSKSGINRITTTLNRLQRSDKELRAKLSNGLGIIYYFSGSLDHALDHYLTAMRLYEDIEQFERQSGCLINIGLIYFERREFDIAMDYYLRSLEVVGETVEDSSNAIALNQIGSIHMKFKRYREALPFFDRSLELFRARNHFTGVAGVLSNLAIIYTELGDVDKAEHIREESLVIYEKLDDKHGLVVGYRNLGKLAIDRGDLTKALRYLQRGIDLARQIDAKPLVARLHHSMAEAFKQQGNFEKALEQFELYHNLNELLFNEKSDEKLQRLTTEYEVEKARREAELHRLKNIELARAQRIAQLGNWEWDAAAESIQGSEEFFRILGLSFQEEGIALYKLKELVFPEDLFEFDKTFLLMKSGRQNAESEFRIVRYGGEVRIVRLQASHDDDLSDEGQSVFIGTIQDITESKRIAGEREKLTYELQEALANIRVLSGLVPICSSCQKIRDDKGFWGQIEEYLTAHSDLEFAHGMCPDCLAKAKSKNAGGEV